LVQIQQLQAGAAAFDSNIKIRFGNSGVVVNSSSGCAFRGVAGSGIIQA
jgi:hypothetical protein